MENDKFGEILKEIAQQILYLMQSYNKILEENLKLLKENSELRNPSIAK